MAEWCLEHPWMTFFLVWQGLLVLDNVVANIVRLIATEEKGE